MTEKEIRKYLLFNKKNKVQKAEAVKRLVTVHKLSIEEYRKAVLIADEVYG